MCRRIQDRSQKLPLTAKPSFLLERLSGCKGSWETVVVLGLPLLSWHVWVSQMYIPAWQPPRTGDMIYDPTLVIVKFVHLLGMCYLRNTMPVSVVGSASGETDSRDGESPVPARSAAPPLLILLQ